MTDKILCLNPGVTLLVKLGSIAVHVEELLSPAGHNFDKVALEQLLADPEFVEWRRQMDSLAMLPVLRNKRPVIKPKPKCSHRNVQPTSAGDWCLDCGATL